MASRLVPIALDSDGDDAQFSLEGVTINAGNFAAEDAKMTAVMTAIQAVCLAKYVVSQRWASLTQTEADPIAPPANHFAQIDIKAVMTFKDNVTQRTFEKPLFGIDLAQFTAQNDEGNWRLDLSAGAGAALKTALDAFTRHPNTGNAASLISVQYEKK